MGRKLKFSAQDSDLEYFLSHFDFSDKKQPLEKRQKREVFFPSFNKIASTYSVFVIFLFKYVFIVKWFRCTSMIKYYISKYVCICEVPLVSVRISNFNGSSTWQCTMCSRSLWWICIWRARLNFLYCTTKQYFLNSLWHS